MAIIYKITNPNNHVYIGQTISKNTRFKKYSNLDCKGQIVLYRSLIKHGFENHRFDILEDGDFSSEELNRLEKYYILQYNSYLDGLNCTSGGTPYEREQRFKAGKNRIMSDEYKRNMSIVKCKKLIDTETDVVYSSLIEAAKAHNMNPNTLCNQLKGRYPNKTNLIYLK